MIPTSVVLSSISAVLKFGRVAVDAYEQHARDQKILLPHSPGGSEKLETQALRIFTGTHEDEVTPPDGPLASHWDSNVNRWKDNPASRAAILDRAEEILLAQGEKFLDPGRSEVGDYIALKQWGENEGPLLPMARVGLAMVDVLSAFVAAHPEAVGLGNNSARFATALARNLSNLLPEYEKAKPLTQEEWAKVDFADQVVLIALRAGLNASRETVDVYIREEHLQQLVLNVTKPLVDHFSSDTLPDYDWRKVRDSLLDPMMQAAVRTISSHQTAFLGQDFDPNHTVGALTQTFLKEIASAEDGLLSMLGEKGAIRLYRSGLDIVARRPDLLIKGTAKADKIGQALIQSAANALRSADPVWRADLKDLGRELLIASVETIEMNKALIFSPDDPWEELAGKLFSEVTKGIRQGLKGSIEDPVHHLLLVSIRTFLEQAALSPEMITGARVREDVQKIVAAVAAAMAKDEKFLLTAEDWPDIVAIAVYEASRNPGRLFKIDTSDPLNELGAKIISSILAAAYDAYKVLDEDKHKFLLFGETLRNAIITALQHAAGNAKAALTNLAALETLVNNLNQVVSERPDELGAAEWQVLFRRFVTVAIDTGNVDSFSVDQLNRIINDGLRT